MNIRHRWLADNSIDDMDKKLLLSIQSECNAQGVNFLDRGLLSITEATYPGAQPNFVFASVILSPIHQPLLFPALQLLRGHVAYWGTRHG